MVFPIKLYFRRKIPVIVLKTCEVGCFHHRPSLSSLQNSRILVELVLFLKVRRFRLEFRAGICGSLHFIILTSAHANKQRPINVHFVRWFSRSKVQSAHGSQYTCGFQNVWEMVTNGDHWWPGFQAYSSWNLVSSSDWEWHVFFLNMYRLGLFICLLTQVLIHSEFYDHEGFFLNLRTAQVGQNSLETENSLIEMCNLRFEVAATKCLTHDKIQKNTLGCRCIGECTWSCMLYKLDMSMYLSHVHSISIQVACIRRIEEVRWNMT